MMSLEKLMRSQASIQSIKPVAENTFEAVFDIENPDFSFKAGQYVTIALPNLKNLPTREGFRDFSIASSPDKLPLLEIVFRKSESPFKKDLLGLPKGSEIIIEGPAGIFTLPDSTERNLVFIAGGVGIAPFRSMIELVNKNNLPYRITLVYCNRSPESSAYMPELEEISKNNSRITLIKVFGPLEEKHISPLIALNPIWYAAGASGLVRTARQILSNLGIIDNDIKTEEFTGY